MLKSDYLLMKKKQMTYVIFGHDVHLLHIR